MSRILVVDDKDMMRDSVAAALTRLGHAVIGAGDAPAAIARFLERTPDVVITDMQMPDMDGLGLLRELRAHDDQVPIIIMTAYGSVETAVAAMKQGAFDYVTKPFSGDELVLAVERAIEHGRLVRENLILRAAARVPGKPEGPSNVMIGSGPRLSSLKSRLAMIADSHGTVLITGESGTGKEVAAHWIHTHSPRADKPFLAINCAALSTSLLESELFGHEKGAFTGAEKLRRGRFELADGGTLLLDEISEISPSIQAKLLRVLQERSFDRVGSSQSRAVDVRVIATSNRDLAEEVRSGTLRADLYFRLNVLPVEMPPLRDHAEDVPELVAHFLRLVANREGRAVRKISTDAVELMQRYHWPGNVRELQNICERASVLAINEQIDRALIEPWLSRPMPTALPKEEATWRSAEIEIKETGDAVSARVQQLGGQLICDGDGLTLERIEREAIVATLERHNGHRQRSAAALGIGVRTLGLKLKKWKEQQLVEPTL
jgi:DNA-binding NtrC family response regulator